MPRDGLVAWGLKRFVHVRQALAVLALLAALPASGCGEGTGKQKAVECRTDDDCDASDLGICDVASCVEGKCELSTLPDGVRCDDSDPLTGEDACLSGICAGTSKQCGDDLGPCLKAVRDPISDECVVEPVEDGVPCDDADACTQRDVCERGECVGTEPKSCAAPDACHEDGECDPDTGACIDVPAPDGTACDDGSGCTTNDSCSEGACQGEAVVCDDGLSCSTDSCDELSGACVADTSGCSCTEDEDCDDGNACNGVERCDPGLKQCRPGTAVVCEPSSEPCLRNSCVPETGACEPEPVVDGTSCDDGNACTRADSCQAGTCTGADAVVCTALSQCHAPGVCDTSTGQCSNPAKPNGASCSDGNACTATDSCQEGACVGSGQASCPAPDQCHDVGVCSPQTGACSNPAKPDGVSCNDDNACTSGDACRAGVCTPAAQVVCTALDSCHTAGVCDPATGVCSNPPKPDGTLCSDGLTCTSADKCSNGACVGEAVTCNDNIACTVDSCSEQLGGCVVNSTACACETSEDCNDGNPCNGVETCNPQTLQCQAGVPLDCSSLTDACNVGTCNAATGACVASPRQDGTTCDDGDLCTQASSCQAGACVGTSPVVCTASDQCHEAGTCNPATGKCSDPPKANGSACNDGSACTQTDTCQGGVCTGSNPVICSASDQCHTAGTCDPATGVCSNPAKSNGSSCSDGSLCTQTDTCQGGICVGGSPVTCSASDQCHTAGTCDPATGACSNPAKPNGSSCSDGSLCTQTDTCQAGVCTGSNPVTCQAQDQCHTAGSCDPQTGTCSNPAKPDGSTCSDGSLCTQSDTCQAGVCTGGDPVVCVAKDQCHEAGVCNATTGACTEPPKANGTPCDDGKACTSGDACADGVCGGAAITCNDGVACTVDTCVEPSGCSVDNSQCGCAKNEDCDDGNACNGVETCNLETLSCVSGTPVSCSNLNDACNVGVCEPSTGACKASPRPNGTSCDDGNACTRSDSCQAGTCVGQNPVVCSASDQCHDAGVCNPATGVCSNPAKANGSTCNDGNACTQADTCQGGVCSGGSPVVCVASDQCHDAGVCNPTTGACSNPAKPNGSACQDGNACTQTDTCQAGSCVGGNPVVCSASDQCHDAGTCNPQTGVCSSPAKQNGTKCDDGSLCTQTDTCQSGVCTGSDPVVCSAIGPCYAAGTCNPTSGLCSNPFAEAGTPCDDSNACTTSEACDGKGTCGGGSAVVCPTPSNPCQVNTCNVTLGCQLSDKPAGTACDDGSACTQVDVCSKGICTGGNPRSNLNGDWADDPGNAAGGATSVDIFTDKEGSAHITGVYAGTIYFNDKDELKTATPLPLGDKQTSGIYWATYKESGEVSGAYNIGGGTPSTLTVVAATGHRDGGFTLLGLLNGDVRFGRDGTTTLSVSAQTDRGYIAHYEATGAIAWVALIAPGKVAFSVDSVSAFEDDAVIATGSVGGDIAFYDGQSKLIGGDERAGVWAVRLDGNGSGQWAKLVALPKDNGSVTVQAVSALDDGGAAFTGSFAPSAKLGPAGAFEVAADPAEKGGRDVWYMKLDKAADLKFAGRVGSSAQDAPGDVVGTPGGGLLLLVNTTGAGPNADNGKTLQPLYSVSDSAVQAHVIQIDQEGMLESAGLIGDRDGGVRGYQLEVDSGGAHAVAGVFTQSAQFYGKLGFGSGLPPVAASASLTGEQGQLTLFAARTSASVAFPWALRAGGEGSGMISQATWDVVLTGHPSHALTLAGMFNVSAKFGDRKTEELQAGRLGNPFVVHVNSEAEYDYCF